MAGFVDFEITWRDDVFSGAPQEGSAADFGTVGINFRARKAKDEAEWWAALNGLSCEVSFPLASIWEADAFYDAGDKGCADGPLQEIATLMSDLGVGQTLEIHATDPTARVDLPAWARMVGHEFVRQQDDRYLLRRSKD